MLPFRSRAFTVPSLSLGLTNAASESRKHGSTAETVVDKKRGLDGESLPLAGEPGRGEDDPKIDWRFGGVGVNGVDVNGVGVSGGAKIVEKDASRGVFGRC